MKYGTYNEELGYSNGPEFSNAFDAINSAWGKCRAHTVEEFDDEGKFIRFVPRCEQAEIWEHEAVKAPAHYREYLYPAMLPLISDEAYKANQAVRMPFKDISDRFNIKWSDDTISSFYTALPVKKNKAAIAIRVQLSLPSEFKAAIDAHAKESRCPWVLTYNKYHKLVSYEKFQQ